MRRLVIVFLAAILGLSTLFFPLSSPTVCCAEIISRDGWAWQNPLPQGNGLGGVWGSSPSDVFAVGDHGTILHYDGSSWSPMSSGTSNALVGVWGTSPSDVFAVGWEGTILHYDGSTWSPMSSATSDCLYGVWGSSPSDVFAVGTNGTILHYDGSSWSPMSSGTSNWLFGVWGTSPSDVFAVGWGGTILHYWEGAAPEVVNWELTNLYETSFLHQFLGNILDWYLHTAYCRFDVYVANDELVLEVKIDLSNGTTLNMTEVEPGHYTGDIRLSQWSAENFGRNFVCKLGTILGLYYGVPTFSTCNLPPGVDPDLPAASITEITILDSESNTYNITSSLTGQTLPETIPSFADALWGPWSDESGLLLIGQCPIDLSVVDSQGRRTGALYEAGSFIGEVNEIPGAVHSGRQLDFIFVYIPGSTAEHRVEVFGKEPGDYMLSILAFDEEPNGFTAVGIPTASGTAHAYSFDWDALSGGEEGVTVTVDFDGDGMIDCTFNSDATLTQEEFIEHTRPVGGTVIPTDKLGLVMPWIMAAALIVAAGVSLAIWNRKREAERASGR